MSNFYENWRAVINEELVKINRELFEITKETRRYEEAINRLETTKQVYLEQKDICEKRIVDINKLEETNGKAMPW